MTIDDVRARLEGYLGAAMVDAMDGEIRALLDDHARLAAELCDVLAERDAMQSMATQNGRERDRAEAEVARLRALLDVIDQACGHNRPERCAESLAAEVARLTRERDEARANVRAWADERAAMRQERDHCRAQVEAVQPRLQAAIEDRDRLAAALAEVREAAREYLDARAEAARCAHAYADGWGPGPARIADAAGVEREAFAHLGAIVLATPADLAATRDARMMEAGRASMQSAINEGFDARDARVRAEAREEIAVTAERYWAGGEEIARWIRAGNEADRIERGGR